MYKMRKYLGIVMISIPFIALFIYGVNDVGWLRTIGVFAGVALIAAWVGTAVYFIIESKSGKE